jgi:hypothetical protein
MALPSVVPPKLVNAWVAVVAFVPPFSMGKVPVTPVVKGNPVAFVKVPDDGVPRAGVTRVGLVDKTTAPVPVELVTPVPPAATGKVPAARAEDEVE